jgi:SAM-dependent methyltransferase
MPMSDVSFMAKDWDERASHDASHYICSERRDWDPEAFFRSGEEDYERLVAPVLARFGFDVHERIMLEVGCGTGRMTRTFAKRFSRVFALDISVEMLKRAQTLNAELENVTWLHGDGQGFSTVESDSVEFVFSYLVLQHIPTKELALGYVKEMLRVLKPGGFFCFQFNSCPTPTMNWKGRAAWGIIDRLKEPIFGLHLERVGRSLAKLLRWDFMEAGRTWRGASLPGRQVLETIWDSGGTIGTVVGWDTTLTWCYGWRSRALGSQR